MTENLSADTSNGSAQVVGYVQAQCRCTHPPLGLGTVEAGLRFEDAVVGRYHVLADFALGADRETGDVGAIAAEFGEPSRRAGSQCRVASADRAG